MNRLCDNRGRFAMLAIDQRDSLRRLLARHQNGHGLDEQEALCRIKHVVTETLAREATAVLTDPFLGYPATLDVLPPHVGVLLSAEVTGYVIAEGRERRSRLIEGWTTRQALRSGADAVKVLIWHCPDASEETQRHQQQIVASVGQACTAEDIPFVLEVVTYPVDGLEARSAAHARRKPSYVIEAARTYSAPRFGVDLLKLEFPANLKYTEEYQDAPFGAGTAVYDLDAVKGFCRDLDAAAEAPWVILSAGVDPAEFTENIRLANAAGASGFLCGRAVWKHVVDHFPDPARMEAYMNEQGRTNFLRIRDANEDALPWHRHRSFRDATTVPETD